MDFLLPTARTAAVQSFPLILPSHQHDIAVVAMAPGNRPPGGIPPTQDLHIFVQNNPDLATKATEYDEMARDLLKGKYTDFAQGSQAVIAHRTAQNPAAYYQAGM